MPKNILDLNPIINAKINNLQIETEITLISFLENLEAVIVYLENIIMTPENYKGLPRASERFINPSTSRKGKIFPKGTALPTYTKYIFL